MSKNVSKSEKLLNALNSGKVITPAQAKKKWAIQNLRAEVCRLRQKGYPVDVRTKASGVTEYEMGVASRDIIAAGYRARASGLF